MQPLSPLSSGKNDESPAASYPVTLGGQFFRHVPAYAGGLGMLAIFQLAMNRIDWLSKAAVDAITSHSAITSTATSATASTEGAAAKGVTRIVLFIFFLAVSAFVTRVLSRYFMFNAGRDVEYELRAAIVERLHRLGAAFYRTMPAGDIMSRATNDLLQVRLLFGFGILNIVNVVFAFFSALQVLVTINGKLTLISLTMFPLIVLATRSFGKRLYASTKTNQETLGKLSERLQANLAGVRIVRSFALEEYEASRFERANLNYLEASLTLARLRGLFGPVAGLSSALSVLAFFWYGGALLLRGPAHGGLSNGDFFAFWSALGRMTWPIVALGFSVSVVQRGRAAFVRLAEIFDAKPEVTDGSAPRLEHVRGALTVNNLEFRYGDRTVLRDVSFAVPAGGSIAIMGRTGSGKSTLATLLARLLPTPPNTVFIDGVDVCTLPVISVREAIGYAQQDSFLFSTTVARNIGFSLDDPESQADIVQHAAREAQVENEILGLPEQYDTVVGERGVQLSGGQKQRVALARALVREPKILVLDDPLSAVDAKTEVAILEAIERQADARTLVLITHRVAAARRCSKIIVLEDGHITEIGTHDELVATNGLYAVFAEEQRAQHELERFGAMDAETLAALPATAPVPSIISPSEVAS